MSDTGRQSFTDKAGSAMKVFLFRQSFHPSQSLIFFLTARLPEGNPRTGWGLRQRKVRLYYFLHAAQRQYTRISSSALY